MLLRGSNLSHNSIFKEQKHLKCFKNLIQRPIKGTKNPSADFYHNFGI
jgi:hypothetical protein